MRTFELIYVVDPIDVETEDRLINTIDASVGGHGSVHLVTITATGDSALQASMSAVAQLRSFGIVVRRLYDDLVTRGQIAERAQVSSQAVGLWARGERHNQKPFPDPYVLAGGGLWRWAEVNAWLRETGKPHDDFDLPDFDEVCQINVAVAQSSRYTRSPYMAAAVALSYSSHRAPAVLSDGWEAMAAHSVRSDFALVG